jgi:hypothetical protein
MANWQLTTPIAFIIFNRPDLTQKVFNAIASAKPTKLFVIADGPRQHKVGETEQCTLTRSIIDAVDWPCEVFTNYSDINLGCNQRISSGLDWVFNQVEEAIILEDDCLPHPTFFQFCNELLKKYRHDERIMAISGDNFRFGRRRTPESYYFSRYNHCWGWATWRRAWQYYDVNMKLWPDVRDQGWLKDLLNNPFAVQYWQKKFQDVHDNTIDTWDFRWTFACWIHNGLSILPNVNLVSNIGFGGSGTHTQYRKNPFANLPTEAMEFPLQHPLFMIRNHQADRFTQANQFGLIGRGRRKIRQILGI